MNNIKLREGVQLAHFFEDVAKELARTYPDWEFASDSIRTVTVLNISCKGEKLGHVSAELKYVKGERRTMYCVEGWRIDEMRQRGNGIQSTKPKEIFKAVSKYIYPLTAHEQVEKGYDQARSIIRNVVIGAQQKVNGGYHDLKPAFMMFARSKWGEFLDMINADERRQALTILEQQQLFNAAKKLFDDVDTRKCLTVYLTDGKYSVGQNGVSQDYDSASVPEHIKTKIGLLKLVEEKEVLPEVGVRVGNVFIIIQ